MNIYHMLITQLFGETVAKPEAVTRADITIIQITRRVYTQYSNNNTHVNRVDVRVAVASVHI